jgi:hypothetical protein
LRVHRELVSGLALLLTTAPALAAGERHDRHRTNILQVPQRYATIQAAVDAADDQILVSRGRFCGATMPVAWP